MTSSLLQSLIDGPLLIEDLPEGPSFDHRQLTLPAIIKPLNHQQKLGHLYEDALAQLLDHSPRFALLERNLQVRKDRHTTLGELDFLIRDFSDNTLIHLELAVKFYLVVHNGPTTTLPGPDARDNYHRKLARLRSHQLQLAKIHRQSLPGIDPAATIRTEHLIYGCLFDHISGDVPFQPEWVSPNARRGKWLTIDELPDHLPPFATPRVIPKPLWPLPPHLLETMTLPEFSIAEPLDRCQMIQPFIGAPPWFVTPTQYPQGSGSWR